jgi:hypothetical protein
MHYFSTLFGKELYMFRTDLLSIIRCLNPLNAKLNSIYHLLALLGAHLIFHVSRVRVNALIPFPFSSSLPRSIFPIFHPRNMKQKVRI